MQMLNHYIRKIDNRKSRRLTDDQVRYIRRKFKSGRIYGDWTSFDKGMARVFDVGVVAVRNAREGKTYQHVK